MLTNDLLAGRKTHRRILICKTRSNLCYQSSDYFLQQIRMALEKQGVVTEYFELREDQSNADDLEQFAGQSYDAVLDINSILPGVQLEDDSYLTEHIHAPFFNYIVDHPMHLHPVLQKAQNSYVICLDETHRQYIRQHYPGISGCFVLPLAASVPEGGKPFQERSRQFFFPGTYVPLVEYKAKLQRMPHFHGASCFDAAEEYLRQYLENSNLPDLPTWYQSLQDGNPPGPGQIYEQCRYMDRYLREVLRHRVLEAVLAEGYTVHVTGAHWEYYEGKYRDRLMIHPPCDYPLALRQMGDSQIVLNVQPLFPNAPHDRILCGMAAGAVVLSDSCQFLVDTMKVGEQYLGYDIRRPEHSLHKLRKYLRDTNRLAEIAEQGRQAVLHRYQWSDWAGQFLEIIDNKNRKR